MKAYLATTATLFSLLALAHLARAIDESSRFSTDPWFWLEGPGIALIGGVLALWGWRLFRRAQRQ
jgi:hypothetical protein